VKKYLFELDLELMLMNSASVDLDNGGNERGIHVWTRKVDSGKIQSVSVDWKSALCLFEAASSNLALYFRSPQNMADEIAAEFAQDLGLDFGSRFMNGDVKPEIEVFVSHKGHCTEWHTDFQENFTFQLKGSKKWFLAKGSYCPLRACTPHYHANEGVEEMQAKAHLIGENADLMKIPTEWEEIILNEGDVLYHPAGVWHKVETLTESVSINISLVGLSWAELMSEAVFHLLARKSEMRRMMSILSTNHANEQANDALNYLKESLENLNASDLLPKCMFLSERVRNEGSIKFGKDAFSCGINLKSGSRLRINPLSIIVKGACKSESEDFVVCDSRFQTENFRNSESNSCVYCIHLIIGNSLLESRSRLLIELDSKKDEDCITVLEWIRSLPNGHILKVGDIHFENAKIEISKEKLELLYEYLVYSGYLTIIS
jgi:hypothetical protein